MKMGLSSLAARQAVALVADRVGIAVTASGLPEGDEAGCILQVLDGHPNESFSVHLRIGWRSAQAVFVPAKFAGPLLNQLGQSSSEGKTLFVSFAESVQGQKVSLSFRVNGLDTDPLNSTTWPSAWRQVDLSLRKFVVSEELDEQALQVLILDLVVPLFSMLTALIGVEEAELPEVQSEGRSIQSLITRYERKKINRELCIRLKGCICYACGFDFATVYGPLGAGYIEVHHSLPVSFMEPGYVVDVRKELFPLCANCHAMAHREDPPVPVEKLKKIVSQRRTASG